MRTPAWGACTYDVRKISKPLSPLSPTEISRFCPFCLLLGDPLPTSQGMCMSPFAARCPDKPRGRRESGGRRCGGQWAAASLIDGRGRGGRREDGRREHGMGRGKKEKERERGGEGRSPSPTLRMMQFVQLADTTMTAVPLLPSQPPPRRSTA